MAEARGEIDLEIRFGNQAAEGVRVALLWKLNNCSAQAWSDPPILAFVNRTSLLQNRSKLYRVTRGPNHSANVPIESLQRLRRKRLIPKSPARDSYLVAVMLAIAQRKCYRHRPTGSPKTSPQNSPMASHAARNVSLPQPEFRDIPVMIITQDYENAEFIVYSTVVTRVFLERFAFPSKAPMVTDVQGGELNIQVTRVQIWPIFGLKQRLAQALCLQIAGDLAWDDTASTDMETLETKHELALRLSNLKRRVEASSKARPRKAPYPQHAPKRMLRTRATSATGRCEATRTVRRSARMAASN
jgi:hypothetical protein